MQRGDVGMIERSQNFYFALKSSGHIFVSLQVGQEHLHRFNPIGDGVPHLVNTAHATAA